MKRQNELGLVGSDEDNLLENTHLEMKCGCDDEHHNCVMMESLASNNKHSRKVCLPNSVQSGIKPQKNVWVFFSNASLKPNETRETRNECTTDRSY